MPHGPIRQLATFAFPACKVGLQTLEFRGSLMTDQGLRTDVSQSHVDDCGRPPSILSVTSGRLHTDSTWGCLKLSTSPWSAQRWQSRQPLVSRAVLQASSRQPASSCPASVTLASMAAGKHCSCRCPAMEVDVLWYLILQQGYKDASWKPQSLPSRATDSLRVQSPASASLS